MNTVDRFRTVESLASRAARLRAQMQNVSTGPLLIAGEVMAIVSAWDSWAAEVGKITAAAWVSSTLGHSPEFFHARAEAVDVLAGSGPRAGDIRRYIDHNVAVWVAGARFPANRRADFVRLLVQERTRRHGNTVPLSGAHRLAKKHGYVSTKPIAAPRACSGCVEREAEIERLRELVKH